MRFLSKPAGSMPAQRRDCGEQQGKCSVAASWGGMKAGHARKEHGAAKRTTARHRAAQRSATHQAHLAVAPIGPHNRLQPPVAAHDPWQPQPLPHLQRPAGRAIQVAAQVTAHAHCYLCSLVRQHQGAALLPAGVKVGTIQPLNQLRRPLGKPPSPCSSAARSWEGPHHPSAPVKENAMTRRIQMWVAPPSRGQIRPGKKQLAVL